jgi:hypothetical protein
LFFFQGTTGFPWCFGWIKVPPPWP